MYFVSNDSFAALKLLMNENYRSLFIFAVTYVPYFFSKLSSI